MLSPPTAPRTILGGLARNQTYIFWLPVVLWTLSDTSWPFSFTLSQVAGWLSKALRKMKRPIFSSARAESVVPLRAAPIPLMSALSL